MLICPSWWTDPFVHSYIGQWRWESEYDDRGYISQSDRESENGDMTGAISRLV